MTETEFIIEDKIIESKNKRSSIFKRNKPMLIGIFLISIIIILAVFPKLIATHDPEALDFMKILKAPSSEHYFGTDNYGRDVFSRVVWATRIDIIIEIGRASCRERV